MHAEKDEAWNKISILILSLMILLIIGSGILTYKAVQRSVLDTVTQEAIRSAVDASNQINGVQYAAFLSNPVEGNDYWALRNKLNDIRVKIGAMYVYTIKVDDQNKPHIMIDGQAKGAKDASAIGDPTSTTTYNDVKEVLQAQTSSAPIVHDPKYGDYLSAFAPIKNSTGQVIGILGVDTSASMVSAISSTVIKDILPLYDSFGVLALVLLVVLLVYVIRRSLRPLKKLTAVSSTMAHGDFALASLSWQTRSVNWLKHPIKREGRLHS